MQLQRPKGDGLFIFQNHLESQKLLVAPPTWPLFQSFKDFGRLTFCLDVNQLDRLPYQNIWENSDNKNKSMKDN